MCAVATAQSKYQFDHWTTDDGLPQNAVNAILQTRDGYLWLATYDGLVRFDGVQFTVFNKGNTKGIGSNRFINLLFEDRHGALWAVTDESWLIKYQAGVFTTFTPKEGLPPWVIEQIEEDEAGNFQIVSRAGIAKWRDGRFVTYLLKDLLPASLGAKWVGGNRLAWFATGNLYLYTHGHLSVYSIQSGLPSLNIYPVVEDQHGTIWLNTLDAGLVRVKDGHPTVYPVKDSLPSNTVVTSVQEDRKGNVWFGFGNGLGRFKDGHFTRYTSSFGLLETAIMCLYEDREGNLWIGASNGLYRVREAAINVLTRREGLASDNIYSIYEDRAGQLWFGTWGDGVTKFKEGCTAHYWSKEAPYRNFVTTLYEDPDGYMWIGATQKLFRLNPAVLSGCNPHFLEGRSAYPDPNGFFEEGVWDIHQDQAGRLWFGTSKGLIKYEGGSYTRYTTADGLASDDVKVILEDRAGSLWFGTWGGLLRYAHGRFTSYTEQDGLASDHIRSLHEDTDGILWVGTYDGGLTRFKDGRFTRYTVKDGLFNNGVFQILEDGRGYFWMSSNRGIYRVKRQELNDFADGKLRSITSVAYGKADGLLTLECNGGRQPAGWKTRDGRLWFPTAHGAAVIDPREINENTMPPPVVIEEVRIAGEPIAPGASIAVPPAKKSFEIEYKGLSFIRPEHIKYKYKLEGLDNDWVDAGTRRVAYYNYVPHGEYTFTVIAANSDGVWNQTGQRIHIKVIPYWWEIRLVQALLLACALLVLFAAVVLRYRRKTELQQEFSRNLIASLDRERKRIADDLHNEPKQYLFAISKYAWLMLNELSGLKESPKNTPAETVDSAIERAREIESLAEKADAEMKGIIEDLRPQQLKELKLTAAIKDWIARSNELSSADFSCAIDSIDGVFTDEAEINLYRLVQEGVNNIVKHSQATAAYVNIKRNARAITIFIEDNGLGFAVKELKRKPGSGLGLKLIQERAQMLGSRAVINSVPGRGTKITVTLDLPDERDTNHHS